MAKLSAVSPSRFDIMNAIDTASKGDTIIIPVMGSNDFAEKLESLTFEIAHLKDTSNG